MAVRVYSFDSSVLLVAVLEHWKRAAFTLAAALAAAAFWRQPFIRWPEMLSLEIQLIPAAGLSGVWAAYGGTEKK